MWQFIKHTAQEYAESLKRLLPLGQAWEWAVGSFGDVLLLATAQELARIDAAAEVVITDAIALHEPGESSYTLVDYQVVADANTIIIPRKPCTIGSLIGYRLWSHNAPVSDTPAPVVVLSHLIQPAAAGCFIGQSLWSKYCRYYLYVRFDRSVIDAKTVLDALMEFKQAHVYLFVNDSSTEIEFVKTWDSPVISWDDGVTYWD